MDSTEKPNAPLHVLMATPPGEEHLYNARVKRDFISRRAAAYNINTNPKSVWANVKQVERALIRCCELPDEMSDDDPTLNAPFSSVRNGGCGYFPLLGGGALDKEMEVQFIGVLAKDCRTLSSRSLALAILERTLEMHLVETEEALQELDQKKKEATIADQHQEVTGEDDIDEDNDDNDDEKGTKRRSNQMSKPAPKYKRTKRRLNEEDSAQPEKESSKSKYEKCGRLEQFFAGGGLKILNRWLEEGLEDEIVIDKSSGELTLQKSSTRALILPICRFLERIPFDKDCVLDSKINKRIRSIEKKIDFFLKGRESDEHDKEDLEGWTTEPTTNDIDGLLAVKDAVKNLKKAWQENNKQKGDGFRDPFKDLLGILRDRLGAVSEYEAGNAARPDWMVTAEDDRKTPKKSRAELAAKERLMEVKIENERTQARRKALEEARREHVERLKQLREKMQARNIAVEKKASGKRIKWKDGSISKNLRDRKRLEEVYVFNTLTPANKEITHIVEGEEPSRTAFTDSRTFESEEQTEEDVDADGTIDLSCWD
jgi:hypothetical protein